MVTVFPGAGFGVQSVSCCVASSSAPIICGADFAGWFVPSNHLLFHWAVVVLVLVLCHLA
jgi:hypothetical protein